MASRINDCELVTLTRLNKTPALQAFFPKEKSLFFFLFIFSYSWNEGETWLTYRFLNSTRMRVYGLLTEPGEQSAEFTLYGSYPGYHRWVVVQINLRKALGKSFMYY